MSHAVLGYSWDLSLAGRVALFFVAIVLGDPEVRD